MSEDIDYGIVKTDQLVRLLAEADAKKKKAEAEAALIKSELNRRLKPGSADYPTIGMRIQVSELRRFDAALAKKKLNKTTLARISVMTPNAKLAQVHLTPEQYESVRKQYDNTIKIDFLE